MNVDHFYYLCFFGPAKFRWNWIFLGIYVSFNCFSALFLACETNMQQHLVYLMKIRSHRNMNNKNLNLCISKTNNNLIANTSQWFISFWGAVQFVLQWKQIKYSKPNWMAYFRNMGISVTFWLIRYSFYSSKVLIVGKNCHTPTT